MNRETNHYEKLANISFDKSDGLFGCDNLVYDSEADIFEDFIETLSKLNRNDTALMANAFYIIDDARRRNK